MSEHETVLLDRLRSIVRDHPQAHVARATGRPRTALTRYMQGGKVPLEFGCALSKELGISADWLLNGRGAMYVTDLPAATTGLGRDLLELIRTMDTVADVKFGLLAGKRQAAALREIADGLARYGSLRERLHARTRPVFEEVLQQLQQALDGKQYDRAAALEATAGSLERFTDDPALSRRLMHSRAHILQVRRQLDRAVEIEARVFLAMVGSSAPFAEIAEIADSLAVSLRAAFNARRARKVLRMALACADEEDSRLPIHAALLSQVVMAGVELGELQGLHEPLARAMAGAQSGQRPFADIARMYYLLFAGEIAVTDVAGGVFDDFPAAAMVLGVAALTEDPNVIERALSPVRDRCNPQMPLNVARLRGGEDLLGVLQGRVGGKTWLRPLRDRARELSGRWQDFEELTRLAQLLRLGGDKSAPAICLVAQKLLDGVPSGYNVLPMALVRHVCNVLRNVPTDTRDPQLRELRNRADALRDTRVAAGLGLLRELGV